MNTVKKTILTASGICTAVLSGTGAFLASSAVHGKRQTLEEAFEWQQMHEDISWYEGLEKENYIVKSFDRYVLHAQLCRCPQPSEDYVILSHGYSDNRFGNLKYMKLYLDRGFNCIIYDLRGHGENDAHICTFSILEGQDLYEMIRDTRKRFPGLKVLGLHGESLGASTTISALGYTFWARADRLPEHYVDFAVADCGFADIRNVLDGAARSKLPFPRQLVNCASAASKLMYGYSFGEMRPIDRLAGNTVPILFLHGEDDTFIIPDNSRRMSEATDGYSELHLIPGAAHANSVLEAPTLYRQNLYAFLDKKFLNY